MFNTLTGSVMARKRAVDLKMVTLMDALLEERKSMGHQTYAARLPGRPAECKMMHDHLVQIRNGRAKIQSISVRLVA